METDYPVFGGLCYDKLHNAWMISYVCERGGYVEAVGFSYDKLLETRNSGSRIPDARLVSHMLETLYNSSKEAPNRWFNSNRNASRWKNYVFQKLQG